MTSNRPAGRPAKNTVPPTSRRSARQQRLASREANRALSKAGTHGTSGPARGSLMLWSLAFVVVAVVVVGALIFATQNKQPTPPNGSPIPPVVVTASNIPSNGRVLGNPDAKVTVDIYEDFRCSFCFDFTTQGDEKNLEDNYIATGKAKLVWHDFITIDRPGGVTESRDAANAAWCAADQGKFWVMHDWLYANQSPTEADGAFTLARLSQIGQDAGLNMAQYQTCLNQGTHNAEIAAEQKSLPKDAGGTPAIYVDNKLVSGFAYSGIKAAIDTALGVPSPSPSASASASTSASASATPTATATATASASASAS